MAEEQCGRGEGGGGGGRDEGGCLHISPFPVCAFVGSVS